ncbi:hypothetical protein BJ170DRAFT_679378 [Xylariales sp. AK1849]|nr:hypothetical protein BJ170DRAFT_679378 [Xylariales sp. AK1849]
MANLPSQHPKLSLHLVDRTLTPLITSSRTQQQVQTLSSMSHTALMVHESAQRLGLGSPKRVIVEHTSNGPVLLHSFLTPASSKLAASQSSVGEGGLQSRASVGGPVEASEEQDSTEEGIDAPPLLLCTVVAPSADAALEARRAVARLERVGREIQSMFKSTFHQLLHRLPPITLRREIESYIVPMAQFNFNMQYGTGTIPMSNSAPNTPRLNGSSLLAVNSQIIKSTTKARNLSHKFQRSPEVLDDMFDRFPALPAEIRV